jgi:hypothetical protein
MATPFIITCAPSALRKKLSRQKRKVSDIALNGEHDMVPNFKCSYITSFIHADTPILPTQQKAVSAPSPVKQPPPSEDSSLKAENPPTSPPSEQAKPSEISEQDEPHDDTPPKPVQENKGRCFKCRVKVV